MMNPLTSAVIPVAGAPQQVPEAAPGGGVVAGLAGGSVLVVVVLGFLLHRQIEKKKLQWSHAIMAFAMGTLLAGSIIGAVVKTTALNIGGAGQQMLTTYGNSDTGTGTGNGSNNAGNGNSRGGGR